MQNPSHHWLPLTEYALRSGMSISTLRRKIKSNTIHFKMEDGRYLICSDDLFDTKSGFVSSDQSVPSAAPIASAPAPSIPSAVPSVAPMPVLKPVVSAAPAREASVFLDEIELLRNDVRQLQDDNLLRWKALEARVSGLAKRLEFFAEQMAETKMLVKIFEEKLDGRG